MSFLYNNDLKIEFRAVPYSTSHVLEYRISPDQDLSFETEESFLGIKYKRKRKYQTNWHQPLIFLNYPGAYHETADDCYSPIFIRKKKDLEEFKIKFKTIGEFRDWQDKEIKRERNEWQIERTNYLEEHKDWY